MPNWVYNKVHIQGSAEDCKAIAAIFKESNPFNPIIPMPQILEGAERSSCTKIALEFAQGKAEGVDFMERLPEDQKAGFKDLAERTLTAYEATGFTDWYGWRLANWDTKWDVSNVSVLQEDNTFVEIMFDTAWSTPTMIFEALLEQFPSISLLVEYADEDIGNNCGILVGEGGVLSEGIIQGQTPIEFAAALWEIDLKEFF